MSNTQANRLKYLLDQFAANTLAEPEFAELIELMGREENEAEIKAALMGELEVQEAGSYDRIYWAEQFRKMNLTPTRSRKQGEEIPVRRMFSWKRVAVAASIIVVLGLGSYFAFFNNKADQRPVTNNQQPSDVQAPQNTKATITLADGRIVTLDSAANGTLAMQGSIKVIKTKEGQIIYNDSQLTTDDSRLTYNTLQNPRGSKVIDMTLADGSRVWLNAGSSVTYPIAFIGNERKVSITGEAYFEVAHNGKKPFKVTKGGMEVTVLGTHFNVNAYDDESDIKVTLLEGSVKVSNSGQAVTIKPGEQARLTSNLKPQTSNNIDLEEVMAWKNGKFYFADATIDAVMKQLARWYDVEIVYEGDKPSVHFIGDISRMENMSQVLKMLEQTQAVRFSIEGKKIIVKKY